MVFLKILKRAGHPTLRPFFKKKAWSFSKNHKTGRSPNIETIFFLKKAWSFPKNHKKGQVNIETIF
jgi:hypothetical protein